MKRQIALVGGQSVPVYLGIQERTPDLVYLIASPESKANIRRIKSCFNNVTFEEHIIDPYGFKEISDLIEKLIFDHEKDEWELNLTSGTKVMSIAAHNIFRELKDQIKLDSFYIDQKGRVFSLIRREYSELQGNLKIATFLKLSGHDKINKSSIGKYSAEDFNLAQEMFDWMENDSALDKLYSAVGYKCSEVKDFSQPKRIEIKDKGVVNWKSGSLTVKTSNGGFSKNINHKNALEMCFTGLWWELLVAKAVKSWDLKKEMMLGVELMTNSKHNYAKNEIDIILNTGKNMIFIECKSGNVRQEDINKMRAVKEMYGGISSRSILVCRKLPRPHILEKCSDLGIDVFALKMERRKKGKTQVITLTSLKQLNVKLTELLRKSQL